MKTYIIWTLIVWLAAIVIKAILDEENWPQKSENKVLPTAMITILATIITIPVWIVEDMKIALLYLLMLHSVYLVFFDIIYNIATNKLSDRPKVNIFYIGNTAMYDKFVRWCIREIKHLFGKRKVAIEADFFFYWLFAEVPYFLIILSVNINYHFDGVLSYNWYG